MLHRRSHHPSCHRQPSPLHLGPAALPSAFCPPPCSLTRALTHPPASGLGQLSGCPFCTRAWCCVTNTQYRGKHHCNVLSAATRPPHHQGVAAERSPSPRPSREPGTLLPSLAGYTEMDQAHSSGPWERQPKPKACCG